MVKAANLIIHFGFYPLSCVFRSCFPGVTYSSATAKCKLLKMPLAAITLGSPSSGTSEVYLMEAVQGVDYLKLIEFLESKTSKGMMPGLTKQQVKDLLCFAQSDRERETLRYTVCHASGLTSSGARRLYGWERMTERSALVEKCLKDAQEIRESIYYLSTTQERAVLKSFGISCISSESSDDSENNLSEPANPPDVSCVVYPIPIDLELKTILTESHFNWFQLAETVLGSCLCEEEEREVVAINQLDDFFRRVIASDHCRTT